MRVLIATDGSVSAASAARALCGFPLPAESTALIVSVAPQLSHAAKSKSAEDLRAWLRDLAKRATDSVAEAVVSRFKAVEKRVVAGDARRAILDAASDWNADLVVIGAHSPGVARTLLLGSVATGVARHAGCSVLVVRGTPDAYRRITVGVDGTDGAVAAAGFVARLPMEAGTLVRLVAVVEEPSFVCNAPESLDAALGSELATWTEELRAELTQALDDAKKLFEGSRATVETAFVDDTAIHGLVSEGAPGKADLLVVGARGVRGFERFLLGSVSETVLNRAPCSVLIVKKS